MHQTSARTGSGAPWQCKAGMAGLHPHKHRTPRSCYPSQDHDLGTRGAGTGQQGRRDDVKILDTMHHDSAQAWRTDKVRACTMTGHVLCVLRTRALEH